MLSSTKKDETKNKLLLSLLGAIPLVEQKFRDEVAKKMSELLKMPGIDEDEPFARELSLLEEGIRLNDFYTIQQLLKDKKYSEAFRKLDYSQYSEQPFETRCNLLLLFIKNREAEIIQKQSRPDCVR